MKLYTLFTFIGFSVAAFALIDKRPDIPPIFPFTVTLPHTFMAHNTFDEVDEFDPVASNIELTSHACFLSEGAVIDKVKEWDGIKSTYLITNNKPVLDGECTQESFYVQEDYDDYIVYIRYNLD